jgi:hypothetical protein
MIFKGMKCFVKYMIGMKMVKSILLVTFGVLLGGSAGVGISSSPTLRHSQGEIALEFFVENWGQFGELNADIAGLMHPTEERTREVRSTWGRIAPELLTTASRIRNTK